MIWESFVTCVSLVIMMHMTNRMFIKTDVRDSSLSIRSFYIHLYSEISDDKTVGKF